MQYGGSKKRVQIVKANYSTQMKNRQGSFPTKNVRWPYKGIDRQSKRRRRQRTMMTLATVNIVIGKIKNFMSIDGVSLRLVEQRYHFGTAKNT
jgi:hypothetical protein